MRLAVVLYVRFLRYLDIVGLGLNVFFGLSADLRLKSDPKAAMRTKQAFKHVRSRGLITPHSL
jgi:hypothetical protein